MSPKLFSSRNKQFALWVLLLLSVLISLSFAPVRSLSRESEVGFEFEGSRELNLTTVVAKEYVGDCPGSQRGNVKAHFTSTATPPNRGLRVIITNVTRGIGGSRLPYSDRKYDKGRFSEGITVVPATRHNRSYLAVLPGKNKFEYQIKRGNTVIESGSFTAEIDVEEQILEREATRSFERYCTTGDPLDKCKERAIAVREVKHCPE